MIGAFVEAQAGVPLAEIVQLDPALVAYEVPYGVRLDALERSGVASLKELLAIRDTAPRSPGWAGLPRDRAPALRQRPDCLGDRNITLREPTGFG